MKKLIYMDYHATTPVDPKVLEKMMPYFTDDFGNPSSRQHRFGWIADEAVESSRGLLASAIGAKSKEIIFTSGATESNNMVLKGVAKAYRAKGNHIITSRTEHKSILDACKRLSTEGCEVTFLPVDRFGHINLSELADAINERSILVSIMTANNEIGTLEDITNIGKLCRERGVLFHTDATQALGKIQLNMQILPVDFLSCSGHKIYGPKGIGMLYIRSSSPRIKLTPLLDGGGHEAGMRSGTLNVPAIVGLSTAVELCVQSMESENERLSRLRNRMLEAFTTSLDPVYLNGDPVERLTNNLNISFPGVEDTVLMMTIKDIAVSTGSACSSEVAEPSHVLKALDLPRERLTSSIRFGLGRFTTEEEVDYTIATVIDAVRSIRKSRVLPVQNASI